MSAVRQGVRSRSRLTCRGCGASAPVDRRTAGVVPCSSCGSANRAREAGRFPFKRVDAEAAKSDRGRGGGRG